MLYIENWDFEFYIYLNYESRKIFVRYIWYQLSLLGCYKYADNESHIYVMLNIKYLWGHIINFWYVSQMCMINVFIASRHFVPTKMLGEENHMTCKS